MTTENQENPNYHNNSDEIDLRDLIIALWEGKWIVIAFVLLAMAATLAYLNLVPQTYKGQIVLKPLTPGQMLTYQAAIQSEVMQIDSSTLVTAFTQSLSDSQPIMDAGGAVGSISISGSKVNFITNNPEQAKTSWQQAMPVYSALAITSLGDKFDVAVKAQKSSQLKSYLKTIASLEQQVHLAKVAGIEINSSPLITNKTLPYIRGYKVLQVEIDLIKTQVAKNERKPVLPNPFKRAGQKLVNYDLLAITLQPKVKPMLMLVLSFILGGMLGVMILIIRNVLRK